MNDSREKDEPQGSPESSRNASCGTEDRGCPTCGGGRGLLIGLALLAVLAGVYMLTSLRPAAPTAPSLVPWTEDYGAALATAARKNEPVLLAFKASWCGPCRWMDEEVFSRPAAAKALASWIPVHIDVDKDGPVARKYQIHGVPTFIVLSPSGTEVDRTSGELSLEELASFLAAAQSRIPAVASR